MRILLIVQPERFDFYSYLAAAENVEWLLLWYEKPGQMKNSEDQLPLQFKGIYYWNQFSTPKDLLNKLKPDRIIFFEIIDLRQIALNVSASARKIPTFYLEHGAAGDKETAISRWKEITFKNHKLPYFFKRIKSSFFDVLRAKYFYYSVLKGFRSAGAYWKYFLLPFKMLRRSPNQVLTFNKFPERVPSKSIVFNKVNFDEYSLYTGIKETDALLMGVPFFDKFYSNTLSEKGPVIYIDGPFLESGILDWNKEHHKKIAITLSEFANSKKVQVIIKLHPVSSLELWKSYGLENDYFQIVQAGDFSSLYLSSRLILSFSSSLVTGFICAKKNVVLLAWHPAAQVFGTDYSKSGLCHLSYYPQELQTKYDDWLKNNLSVKNDLEYEEFLKKFNSPFDGKATERVLNTIISG